MSTWDKRFEERPARTGALLVVGVVFFVLVLGWAAAAATLGIRTATAGLVGRANVHITNQAAPNRIVQQAGFETSYASYVAYLEKIKDAGKGIEDWDRANAGRTDNAIGSLATQRMYLVQVRDGLRQQCQNTVAEYNSDTHKTLARDWKRSDLPYELDTATCR